MKKRIGKLFLCSLVLCGLLMGCGDRKTQDGAADGQAGQVVGESTSTDNADSSNAEETTEAVSSGKVYFLNTKGTVSEQLEAIAKEYTEKTGVEVKVVTAASGTYTQTLKSELAKKDAPTLFIIDGPVGYQMWKDYCMDLSDTKLYKEWLIDDSMAVKGDDGGVYGIPYVIEGYGVLYNNRIMQEYFALPDKAVEISSVEEIDSFDKWKRVVEDMTAHKEELGIKGVFACTSMGEGAAWRWTNHLSSVPLYYEYRDKGIVDTDRVELTYSENFKNVFDLYLNNSSVEPSMLGSKQVADSMAEFALEEVAMAQNGNWGWKQIAPVEGIKIKEEDIKFMPIYIGVEGEEKQGISIGTENNYAVNSQASEEDQKATIEFLEWLYSSEEGKKHVTEDLGFISPFNTFSEGETPSDPLAKEVVRYLNDSNYYTVNWTFVTFPGDNFKNAVTSAMFEYTQGREDWSYVQKAFVDNWAIEKDLLKEQ